jgi:hypothetical protein
MASLNPGQAVNASTQTGVVCPANKYSVGGTHLSACTNCPSGMVTVGKLPANHNSVNDCRECYMAMCSAAVIACLLTWFANHNSVNNCHEWCMLKTTCLRCIDCLLAHVLCQQPQQRQRLP